MNSFAVLTETSRVVMADVSSSDIRLLVVHRNPNVAEEIRQHFTSRPEFEVVSDCVSGTEAAEVIQRLQPDVILLDVQVPQLEKLKELRGDRRGPVIFYLIGEESTILSQFKRTQRELLLTDPKNLDLAEIYGRMRRQLSRGGRRRSREMLSFFLGDMRIGRNRRFAFKNGKKLVVLDVDDVLSIESDGPKSRLHTANVVYSLRYSLAHMMSWVDPQIFHRISSSALVNVNAIRELSFGWGCAKFVVLKDGRTLQAAQSYSRELKRIIDASWGLARLDTLSDKCVSPSSHS
jgi:two-component system LytT family response regulator